MYDDEESVYQLIPQVQAVKQRPPKYRSKHNHTVPPTFSTFGFQGTSKIIGNVVGEKEEKRDGTHPAKKAAGTFGRTISQTINPKQFLRKSEGLRGDPTKEKFEHTKTEQPKPSVPLRSDKPIMGLSTDKNFVVANAVEAILAVPKKTMIDPIRHVDKGVYGKVPAYISRTKRELAASAAATIAENEAADSHFHELTPTEVQELRDGLKSRYEAVQKQFMGLSLSLETTSQLRLKENLERELRRLEQAMARLKKNHVFVRDD